MSSKTEDIHAERPLFNLNSLLQLTAIASMIQPQNVSVLVAEAWYKSLTMLTELWPLC